MKFQCTKSETKDLWKEKKIQKFAGFAKSVEFRCKLVALVISGWLQSDGLVAAAGGAKRKKWVLSVVVVVRGKSAKQKFFLPCCLLSCVAHMAGCGAMCANHVTENNSAKFSAQKFEFRIFSRFSRFFSEIWRKIWNSKTFSITFEDLQHFSGFAIWDEFGKGISIFFLFAFLKKFLRKN